MKTIDLKTRILLPLTLVSSLALAVFVFGVYRIEHEYLTDNLAQSIQEVKGHYQATLKERANKLGALLELAASDAGLKLAIKARNHDMLLKLSLPLFNRLKTKYNITHLYFHDAQRINILRVHNPDRSGDLINRFTALSAQNNNALAHGVELGPLGTFTLRAVLPVWVRNQLVGYIELGEEIDQIVKNVEKNFNVKIEIAIDKKFLLQSEWEFGMTLLGRKAQWGRYPQFVVSSQQSDGMPIDTSSVWIHTSLDKVLELDNIEAHQDKHQYQGRILALQDAGKRTVGGMMVLHDVSAHIHNTATVIAIICLSALVLGLLLFILVYIILGRTENKLLNLLRNLRESQYSLTRAQHLAHLGNWKWDLTNNQVYYSEEAHRILGITTPNGVCTDADLLALIHPSDQPNFQHFIYEVRNNKKIHKLTHSILRPDGTERNVCHHAELVCDASDSERSINATIHDVTELQQAEARLARMGRILELSWNEFYAFDAHSLSFIEVSDGACQNLGYSRQEMKKLTPLDLNIEMTRNQFDALIGPLRRGEKQQICFENEHQRKDGSRYPIEVRLHFSMSERPPAFFAIIQDISERKHYIEKLEYKALFDELTDLPNRFLFQDRLQHALKVAHRETAPLAVLIVDVIRLGEINDLLGHQNGDQVLKEVADRLQKRLRKSDTVARLGGDEFAIVLPNVDHNQVALAVETIQKLFEQPVTIDDTPFELESAIGAAQYPDHGETPAILLQHADIAMRVAKNETNGFCIYNPKDDPFSVLRLRLHGELRQAINNKSMTVYYQPKIDLKTGRVVSVEALARWPHATEGMIAPNDFIPMIEQSGLIRPFTLWVLEQAIKQQQTWESVGINLAIAVNLSTRNLLDPSLSESIANLIQSYNINPNRLTLEITESSVMSRPETALKMLTQLHGMGIKLSIDDFGTGYSSLAYLKKLPVTELKIDYSFVSGIATCESDALIVQSTIELAHNLGLNVVAEGVENKDILDQLKVIGCDIGQGFYFNRPQPPDELLLWLANSPWGIKIAETI